MSEVQRRGGPQYEELEARFGVHGANTESATLEPTIQAVAFVPRLDNLCGGFAQVAASAAKRAIIQLFNPIDSGVLLILHRAWISRETPGSITLRAHNTPLTTLVTNSDVLSRTLGNQPEPSGQMRTQVVAAVGDISLGWELDIALRSYEIDLTRLGDENRYAGPSLAEGRGLQFVPGTDDVDQTVTMMWSERVIQD